MRNSMWHMCDALKPVVSGAYDWAVASNDANIFTVAVLLRLAVVLLSYLVIILQGEVGATLIFIERLHLCTVLLYNICVLSKRLVSYHDKSVFIGMIHGLMLLPIRISKKGYNPNQLTGIYAMKTFCDHQALLIILIVMYRSSQPAA